METNLNATTNEKSPVRFGPKRELTEREESIRSLREARALWPLAKTGRPEEPDPGVLVTWKSLSGEARLSFQNVMEARLRAYEVDRRPHRRDRLGSFAEFLGWWGSGCDGSCERVVAEDGKLDWCDLDYARPRELPVAITSRQAYTALGISQSTFSKACKDLGIKPAGTYTNPADQRRTPGMTWSLEDVERIRASRAAKPACQSADKRKAEGQQPKGRKLTTSVAAKRLGISRGAFRHAARSAGVTALSTKRGPEGCRWAAEDVEKIRASRSKLPVEWTKPLELGPAPVVVKTDSDAKVAFTQHDADALAEELDASQSIPSSSEPAADAPAGALRSHAGLERVADKEQPKGSLTHVVRMSEGRPVEILVDEWREVARADFKPTADKPRGVVIVREHRKDGRLLLSGASGTRWERFAGYILASDEIDRMLGVRLEQLEAQLGLAGVGARVLPSLPARRI